MKQLVSIILLALVASMSIGIVAAHERKSATARRIVQHTADLVPEDVFVKDDIITIRVCNRGNHDIHLKELRLKVENIIRHVTQFYGREVRLDVNECSNIPTGTVTSFEATKRARIKVLVDPNNSVREANKENNELAIGIGEERTRAKKLDVMYEKDVVRNIGWPVKKYQYRKAPTPRGKMIWAGGKLKK